MSTFFGTLIVGLVLAVILAFVIYTMVRDKKRGKSSCGCNCSHCPSAGMCHSGKIKAK